MRPDSENPHEVEGVLNPGACRDHDGQLLLFPRIVAPGNVSRIGIAEVLHDKQGVPVGVNRLSYALEPQESYEKRQRPDGIPGGGVEDPRVSYLPVLDLYVMTYVAFGDTGPRTGLAVSEDAYRWSRLGLFEYDTQVYYGPADFNRTDNKDAVFFDRPVLDPAGVESIAILHRPTFEAGTYGVPQRPSIWISYVPLEAVQKDLSNLLKWSGHRIVAEPQEDWETLKIGAGPPPVWTDDGWFLLYHGVSGTIVPDVEQQQGVCYCPGAMFLDSSDPGTILGRSQKPLLRPVAEERQGIVPNVIFPTALDGQWFFYGMGDSMIGLGRLGL
jgi:predicted GH43/DUF377 family glycosyl hydrolase